jgi:hypothetical protein
MNFDDDTAPNKKKPIMPKDSLEVQAMHAALVSQHGEIEALKRKLKTERANHRFTKAELDVEKRFGSFAANPSAVLWPHGMLDRLVRLCHPDKHANSSAANDVTAWLLKQRRS